MSSAITSRQKHCKGSAIFIYSEKSIFKPPAQIGFAGANNTAEFLPDQGTFVYLLLTFLVGRYCFYY
jgi:hypothetical protein